MFNPMFNPKSNFMFNPKSNLDDLITIGIINTKQSNIFDYNTKNQNTFEHQQTFTKNTPKTKSITDKSSNKNTEQKSSSSFKQAGATVAQQAVSAAVVSIADKLIRGQPLNWKDTTEATGTGVAVCVGTIAGGNFCGQILEKTSSLSSTTATTTGASIGAGVVTAIVDLGITAYKKGGLSKLEGKDYGVATGKGIAAGVSAGAAEFIISKSLSTSGTACAGAGLGAVISTGFALWAMYETRTLKDYDMNKWIWSSVGSAVTKGAISTGAALATTTYVATALAVTNWWNPIGWAAGIGVAVISHCVTTFIEEKCSDSRGQRKKHMNHCCQVLGCSDNITKKQFAGVVRRNRAKFHPDKSESENDDEMKHVQECIDAYCILRKWDAEELFTDKDKISKSWARKLFKNFFDAVSERFRAISILKVHKIVKENKCFVNQLIVFNPDEEIPEFASIVPGGEEIDKKAKENKTKKLRVIYNKEEYKQYSITTFTVSLNKDGNLNNVSCNTNSNDAPIRTVLIIDHKPKNNNSAKVICKISSNNWLIGLTDDSEQILQNTADNHDTSMEDELD